MVESFREGSIRFTTMLEYKKLKALICTELQGKTSTEIWLNMIWGNKTSIVETKSNTYFKWTVIQMTVLNCTVQALQSGALHCIMLTFQKHIFANRSIIGS